MGLFYDMAYGAAALVSVPFLAARMVRKGKHRTDWAARFGHTTPLPPSDAKRTLLIHGVSVGEVNAIRQLVTHLRQTHPDWRIVISATTDTGVAHARRVYDPDIPVVRMPFDFTRPVKRFLNAVKPDMVALVELEVWPNLMHQCAWRGIPTCVINGRLSAHSFKGYYAFAPVLRPTFLRLSAVAAQTEDYATRFRKLGVLPDRVQVLDSMKWDTAVITEPDAVEGASDLAQDMGIDRNRPLIVAGSTAPGEEKMLIDTCPPDAQLLIAPRKPERFNEVAALSPEMIRRTQYPQGSRRAVDGKRLFLLDTIGDLRKAYALATVALVGRSFVPGFGGSDPLEAIALGVPTAIGPHVDNFSEMVNALSTGGGIAITHDPGKLAATWIADRAAAAALAERGRDIIRSRQGATKRHADLIESLMPEDSRK